MATRSLLKIFLPIISASLSLLILESCGLPETDKLLVFYESVMPATEFERLTGRYRIAGEEEILRITDVNERLFLETCSDGELTQLNFIVSAVPRQTNLQAIAFPPTEIFDGNEFVIFRYVNNGLSVWGVDPNSTVAEDYFPPSIEEKEDGDSI
ncbi:MAG: hypothetical protein AAFQ14_08710 [Cyanobacteria bacterium J06621_12]